MITVPSWGMVVAALIPEGRIGRLGLPKRMLLEAVEIKKRKK